MADPKPPRDRFTPALWVVHHDRAACAYDNQRRLIPELADVNLTGVGLNSIRLQAISDYHGVLPVSTDRLPDWARQRMRTEGAQAFSVYAVAPLVVKTSGGAP